MSSTVWAHTQEALEEFQREERMQCRQSPQVWVPNGEVWRLAGKYMAMSASSPDVLITADLKGKQESHKEKLSFEKK